MSETEAIERGLAEAGLPPGIRSVRPLAGGCIHRVCLVTLADDRSVVAKTAAADRLGQLEQEAHGLRSLDATGAVLVPTPLAVGVFAGTAVLLIAALAPGRADDAAWRRLGHDLAALHGAEAGTRYGFAADNHLGATPQPNAWAEDWVEFNVRHRLGFQVDLAGRHDRLHADERRRLDAILGRLDRLLPRRPRPSLLHGDLWSGNALPAAGAGGGTRIALIDPACSVGDGWADVAMMRLFGGFSPVCFAAYADAVDDDDDHDEVERRIAVYQLYHLLNHLNLFGRGYAGQVMETVGRLGGGR